MLTHWSPIRSMHRVTCRSAATIRRSPRRVPDARATTTDPDGLRGIARRSGHRQRRPFLRARRRGTSQTRAPGPVARSRARGHRGLCAPALPNLHGTDDASPARRQRYPTAGPGSRRGAMRTRAQATRTRWLESGRRSRPNGPDDDTRPTRDTAIQATAALHNAFTSPLHAGCARDISCASTCPGRLGNGRSSPISHDDGASARLQDLYAFDHQPDPRHRP